MPPLVGAAWLARRLGTPGLVVLDASVGRARGAARRVPGAVRFDIDGEFSDPGSPLPHMSVGPGAFQSGARSLGVDDRSTVVVYDAVGVYSSARAWWMFRAAGFDRVAVLDGGLPAYSDAGMPVEDEPAAERADRRGDVTVRPRPGLFVGRAEVAEALADPRTAVVDARTRERFAGTAPEPRPGLRGGHMPGSVNLPFGGLQDGGRMRDAGRLRAAFQEVAGDRERLVVSCGSGVTACVLALGATLAGRTRIAVYDGSWSEWGLTGPVDGADEG
ncbi:sulfurtransferase [uncultured Streptomyces sp.]|uniref:sulfurtransferase n=1 Tax=uncultured Streptomyces sp. TaxID=174707 RepID=UPI00260E9C99|nr:sulfurtransferase [uncultured Streptomyces sp.]